MIKTAFYSLVVLQNQFVLLTGADLPKEGSKWVEDNVDRVHKYLLDLGDALVVSHAIGATLGVLFYAAAWVVLCLDFRAQVTHNHPLASTASLPQHWGLAARR